MPIIGPAQLLVMASCLLHSFLDEHFLFFDKIPVYFLAVKFDVTLLCEGCITMWAIELAQQALSEPEVRSGRWSGPGGR